MASPTVHSYSSGVVNDFGQLFDITLPATISSTDTLLLFISSSPSSWAYPRNTAGGTWYTRHAYYPYDYFSPCLSVLVCEDPSGGGVDELQVGTYFPFWHNGVIDSRNLTFLNLVPFWLIDHKRNTQISYVCYAISGMKKDILDAVLDPRYTNQVFVSGAFTSYWDLLQCPLNDDSLVGDYLWIAAVASKDDTIATGAPSGFSALITAQADGTDSEFDCSISSCYRSSSGVSVLDPGAFTALSAYWAGIFIRIPPPELDPEPEEPIETGGIGLYIRNKEFHTYDGLETVIVYPDTMNFNSDGSENGNPFQTYIELYASNSWTASWINDAHFDASVYSGSEGSQYIAITCRGSNTSGSTYLDTLTVISGSSNDTVTVYQVSS